MNLMEVLKMWTNTYYGSYRTRTFQEIFPSGEAFKTSLQASDIPLKLKEESVYLLYGLLYARYGNSHIMDSDENQFEYKIASTIFMYGPTWEKRLEVQEELRNLTIDELRLGSKDIYNSAMNPGTAPSTSYLEELPAINSQNTTSRKKSVAEGYSILLALLETDVSKEFIDRFSKLFIKILEPDYPLLYSFSDQLIGGILND